METPAIHQRPVLRVGIGGPVGSGKTAVMVAGTAVHIQGEGEDAHAIGLCSWAKQADVTATVDGEHLGASTLEIE